MFSIIKKMNLEKGKLLTSEIFNHLQHSCTLHWKCWYYISDNEIQIVLFKPQFLSSYSLLWYIKSRFTRVADNSIRKRKSNYCKYVFVAGANHQNSLIGWTEDSCCQVLLYSVWRQWIWERAVQFYLQSNISEILNNQRWLKWMCLIK